MTVTAVARASGKKLRDGVQHRYQRPQPAMDGVARHKINFVPQADQELAVRGTAAVMGNGKLVQIGAMMRLTELPQGVRSLKEVGSQSEANFVSQWEFPVGSRLSYVMK